MRGVPLVRGALRAGARRQGSDRTRFFCRCRTGSRSSWGLSGLALAHVPAAHTRLNAAEMYVDVVRGDGGVSTRWIAESGVVDLFFLLGPRPADVTEQARTAWACVVGKPMSLG